MAEQEVETVIFPTERDKHDKIVTTSKEYIEQQDKSKFEYVEIPEFDMFNKRHQGVSLNGVHLTAGKRYFVGPTYAREIRDRLDKAQKADIRILQSHPDQKPIRGEQGMLMVPADHFNL